MKTTAVVCAALMLSACASLKITIHAAPGINPNSAGVSAPIRVKLFELGSRKAFDEADYDYLFNQQGQHFDTDVLKIDEFSLFPGQQLSVQRPLVNGATAIGVVAAYTVIPRLPWKACIEVSEQDFYIDKQLHIVLSEKGLLIK